MDIGTIEGALKLKDEASQVLKQFEINATTSAVVAAQQIQKSAADIINQFASIQDAAKNAAKTVNESFKDSAAGVSQFAGEMGNAGGTFGQTASQAAQAASGLTSVGQAAQAAGAAAAGAAGGAGGGGFAGLNSSMLGTIAGGTALGQVLAQVSEQVAGLALNVIQLGAQGFRQAISDASDFQSSLTKIINLTDESKESVARMGQQVLGLAGKVGTAPQELADALYFVAGAGIHGQQAMDVLTQSAQASAIGLGKTQDVAHALTGVLNAFQGQNLTAAEATRVLIATVNEGNVEANQLANTLGRVVGQAGEVGASFADVGTFIATFTRVGVQADEAVTALRGLLSTLIKPAKQSREALEEVGLSVDELRAHVKERGLVATLQEMYDKFDGNLDVMGKVIPNVRALAGFLATAGEQGKQFAEIQQNITAAQHDQNYVTERMLNLQETLGFQWKSLKADAQAASVSIGTEFLPALTEVVKDGHEVVTVIGDVAKAFAGIAGKVATMTIDLTLGQLKGVKGAVDLASHPGGIAGAIGQWISDQVSEPIQPKTDILLPAEIGQFNPTSNIGDILKRQSDGIHSWVQDLADARVKVSELSDANKAELAAALKIGGDAAKKAADQFGLNDAALKIFTEDQKSFTKETATAGKQADAAGNSYAKMFDTLTGNDSIAKANQMLTVIQELGSTKMIDPAQAGNVAKTLQDGIDAAARFGQTTAQAFGANTGEVEGYVAQLKKVADAYKEQQDFGKLTLQTTKTDIKAVADEVGNWASEQDKLGDQLEKTKKALLGQAVDKQSKQFQQYAKDIIKTSTELDKLHDEFGNATGASKDLYDQLVSLKQTELDGYFERILTRTPELRGAIEGLGLVFGGLGPMAAEAFGTWAEEAGKTSPKTKTAKDDLKELSTAFSDLATVSSGAFSNFAKGIGQIIEVADVGKKAGTTFLKGFADATATGSKDWGGITTNLVAGLLGGIGAVQQATSSKSLLQNIIGGAATGAELGTSIGTAVGVGIAAEIGASTAKGAAVGGVWGAAAGAIFGIIIAVWRSSASRAVVKQVGQEWGVSISDGMADILKEDAKHLAGGIDVASILHFGDILKEAGGLSNVNFDSFLGKLHDVFSFLERGQIDAAHAQDILNDNFGKFADIVVRLGKVAPQAFADIVRLNAQMGVNSQAILDFVSQQTGKLGASIAALAGPLTAIGTKTSAAVADAQAKVDKLAKDGKEGSSEWKAAVDDLNLALAQQKQAAIDNADQFARLGTITLASFNAAVAAGLSVYQAMQQIGPSIDALIAAQQQLGIENDNAALSELEHFRQMVAQNETLVAAASALGDTLVALSTIGGLNIDTFKALEDQGVDTFNKLIAAGFTDKEALATIQGYLQNVIEAHEELGFPIDENTQALIDQAREYGLLKKDSHDAATQMHDDLMNVVDAINNLARGLGVDVPNAAAQAAAAIGQIPTDITLTPRIGNPGTAGDETAVPEHAKGGIATRASLGIFGEKGPEALIPLNRATQYGFGGGTKTQQVNFYVDGKLMASKMVEHLPDVIDLFGGVN